MNRAFSGGVAIMVTAALAVASAYAATTIRVDAGRPGHRVSRYLTAACMEDVNHEVYGGIYSQMLFGESFQEPAPDAAIRGFVAHGGTWAVKDGVVTGSGRDGPKLVREGAAAELADGEAAVELFFADRAAGNAGLIVRVERAGRGADRFTGYEVALIPDAQALRLARHRQNYEPIRDVPCEVPVGRWVDLRVRLAGSAVEVLVDGKPVLWHDDAGPRALRRGAIGLRTWEREARFRHLRVRPSGGAEEAVALEPAGGDVAQVSGMWRAVQRGSARGSFALDADRPFVGRRSQRITFDAGEGEWGVENRGLNRCGLHVVGGRIYEGILWARTARAATLHAAIETGDGARVLAERALPLEPGDWRRLTFELTPAETASGARFAVKLKAPGDVVLGYALLQPGEWGRFKGLPVRRDVAEGLVAQGLTLMRYGGLMANAQGYRWKEMIGPRDRRRPYSGFWYPHSTHGFGIVDFVAFCRAAGFEPIPDFWRGESPQDMADFVEYANGPATSEWGRRRAADGFAEPLNVRYVQVGNEERVDEAYVRQFAPIAEAVWGKDKGIVLIVGDFQYARPIADPMNVRGAASGITSLAAHRQVLRLAARLGGEVWFDVHLNTEGPRPDGTLAALPSFVDAIERMARAEGARARVVVLELNANNHAHRRALANALALHAIERDGRVPVVASANALQVDGQNDNGWDQGLLFMNPARVWLQPPGYVTRMASRAYLPLSAPAEVKGDDGAGGGLDVIARRSEDGKVVVVQVVNAGDRSIEAGLTIDGFMPARETAAVETLAAPLDAVNAAEEPERVRPTTSAWRHGLKGGAAGTYTFPPRSFTVMRFE